MNQISDDLLNEVNTAKEPPKVRVNFGLIEIDIWACALIKGQGKVQFDANQHDPDQRRTAIDMTLTPLPSSRFHDPITRNLIAQSSEWTNIVRPSLEALKADVRAVNGRFVQVEMVETGRKWKDASGEEKKGTTFKFVRIFVDQGECEAASAAFFGRSETSATTATASVPNGSAANGHTAPAISADRTMASKFLPGLWAASKQDPVKFVELIKANKLTAAHFDEASEEVAKIILGG